MAWISIPVINAPWASLTVKLDGTNYQIETHYNERNGGWYFDLMDEDGNVLRGGIRITVDWPLTGWRETDPRMPPGMLWAVDTSGKQIDPDLDTFGTRVLMLYNEILT